MSTYHGTWNRIQGVLYQIQKHVEDGKAINAEIYRRVAEEASNSEEKSKIVLECLASNPGIFNNLPMFKRHKQKVSSTNVPTSSNVAEKLKV